MRLLAGLLLGVAGAAGAQQVAFQGRMGDKALLVIDGAPRMLATGGSAQGVRLLTLGGDRAEIEVGGKRVALILGGAQVNLGGAAPAGGGTRIVLPMGSGGHFFADGSINGKGAQFMVDTGATNVSMGRAAAERMGVAWQRGTPGLSSTANGTIVVHRVKLDQVRVGEVTLYNIDASVVPVEMPHVLLGNSFLSRFQMKRENDLLTLERRF